MVKQEVLRFCKSGSFEAARFVLFCAGFRRMKGNENGHVPGNMGMN